MVMSHTYDEKSILKSEHRVFSTIMYKVKITRNPIHIMETIICIMCKFNLNFVKSEIESFSVSISKYSRFR